MNLRSWLGRFVGVRVGVGCLHATTIFSRVYVRIRVRARVGEGGMEGDVPRYG